jgi:photosystem II stability/assembly factor-like uncharacterized protein
MVVFLKSPCRPRHRTKIVDGPLSGALGILNFSAIFAPMRLVPTRLRHFYLVAVAFVAASTLAAAGAAQSFALFRSTDDGRSWLKVGGGLPPDLRIDALGQSGATRVAGTERGLYLSTDDGATWSRPVRGLPENLKVFDFAVYRQSLYAATAQGLWSSADHGSTWARVPAPFATTRLLSLTATSDTLFVGTDAQGVFTTNDAGGSWHSTSDGLPPLAQIFQFAAVDDTVYAALYSRGLYRYDRAQSRWLSAGDERPLRLAAFRARLFAGRNPGGVFTAPHLSTTWSETSRGLPAHAPTWALAATPHTVLLGTVSPAGLMRWDAASGGWQPSDAGLPRQANAIAFGVAASSLLVAVFLPP